MQKNRNNREYILFDIETTGLNTSEDKIVEFACCVVNKSGKEVEKRLKLLINPEISIPERVIKIHGITDKMVRNKPAFKEVAEEIKEKFENRIAIAYFGFKFDFPFLKSEFRRCNINFKFHGCIDPKVRINNLGLEKYRSLVNISKIFKIFVRHPHRAMPDVRLLKGIFKKIYIEKSSYVKNNTYDIFDPLKDLFIGDYDINYA